jgi:CDP-glucose 4,6-dehydratase
MFKNIYNNKKVLITGNTGFKGSWLTTWLIQLGANVIGISKDIPTKPSLFEQLLLENKINHYFEDLLNLDEITKIINHEKPDFIFHLAAQAIVSESFHDPLNTIKTNTIGTMNILEVLRHYKKKCYVLIITSDKSYENLEWVWGYRENDNLGGNDIYSGSKGAAELIIKSYYESFLKKKSNIRIGVCRAGNVIGGGDWAKDRLIADCMRSWSQNKTVVIRNPNSTRPWQHVLEPLSGYLTFGLKLFECANLNGQAFNFGPKFNDNHTVLELISVIGKNWKLSQNKKLFKIVKNKSFNESLLLKLNCDSALFHLNWEANLNFQETVKFVSEWYLNFYNKRINMYRFTKSQIVSYIKIARKNNLNWSND